MALDIPFLNDMISNDQANVLQGIPLYAGPDYGGSNFLQGINAPKLNMQDVQAATPRLPRKRSSMLDTIGKIADVLAIADDSTPMYTTMQQAQEDRTNQVDMDAMRRQLLQQQIDAGNMAPQDAMRVKLGQALGALDGVEGAAELWPQIAEQAGIDPQKAAAIGQMLQRNPGSAAILARSLGAADNLGKNVFFGTDPQGKTVAYQVGPDGRPHVLDFNGELTPSDPTKTVDLGGTTAIIGSGGNVKRILPKTEAPGRGADRASRERIAASGIAARERIAATKSGSSAVTPGMIGTVQGSLQELRGIYDQLNKMGAMVSPSRSTGSNIAARARASGVGQAVEGAVGTEAQTLRDRINSIRPGLMQSIAKATGMTGKQLDSNTDVKLFMQTVTNPASSYEANIQAIKGLERFVAANSKAAPTPSKPAAKSGGGGWGKATVIGR